MALGSNILAQFLQQGTPPRLDVTDGFTSEGVQDIDYQELIIGGLLMPIGFDFSIRASNNITITPLLSGRGSIKEVFASNDKEISLTILAINIFENDLPREFIEDLVEMFDNPRSLEITNEYFNLHNIQFVVPQSMEIGARGQNYIFYTLTFISDEPGALEIEGD